MDEGILLPCSAHTSALHLHSETTDQAQMLTLSEGCLVVHIFWQRHRIPPGRLPARPERHPGTL